MTYRAIKKRYLEEYQGYYYDINSAERVIRFFEKHLTHQLGELAGQPIKLEHWQKRILRHFFGWRSISTNLRKYRTLYLEIPRKNGKSILAAGLGLYLTDADREPAARVACFAANEDQVKEAVFDVAKGMVEASPLLSERMKCFKKTITSYAAASNFQILTGSKKGKHGKNLSAVIGDEVHEWETREVVDALTTSMVTRAQPVEIYLTTAGYDRNSYCYELHEYSKNIRNGIIKDPTFLGIIYAAIEPKENNDPLWWNNELVWKQANPNLAKSVRLDYLRREAKKAVQILAYENTFKRLHLNIWTEQDSRWLSLESWRSCKEDFTLEDLKGRNAVLGVDLAATTDLGVIVIVCKPSKQTQFKFHDKWLILPLFYLPKKAIKLRKEKDRIPYDDWERLGLIKTNDGGVLDYKIIEDDIDNLAKIINIQAISIDPWNAVQFAVNLKNKDYKVQFWRQGYTSMNAPTKMLSELIASLSIHHNDNLVLNWNAANVTIESDPAGNIKPSKRKSKEKIDGIVAAINGIGCAVLTEDTESTYETNEPVILG